MKKSIGRMLAHIDVAANTSGRIHEDFFNSHRISQHLSKLSSAERANHRVNSGVQFRNAASQNRSKFRQRWEDQSL
jgi:hypothetical protein